MLSMRGALSRSLAAATFSLVCGATLACTAVGAAARPSALGPFAGKLSPARSTASFHISVKRPSVLSWTYRGPAVRFVITAPNGAADGPGVTSPYRVPGPGRYTVAISSNTMAEGIYGPYRITFGLRPSP